MKRAFAAEEEEELIAAKRKVDENENVSGFSTNISDLAEELLDATFCHLSLNDLCSLHESKNARMKKSTGDYFTRMYKSKHISVKMNRAIELQPRERYVQCFIENIQNINIIGGDIEIFEYVARHLNKSPKKIRFQNLLHSWPTQGYGKCLMKTLENVEVIEFFVSRSSGTFFNSILKYCKNIKSLRIRSQCFKEDRFYNLRSNWFYQKYPTLESIQWDDGVKFHTKELKMFFNNNPNVKNFSIARNYRNALQFLLNSDIKLDQLTVICQLYNRKYFSNTLQGIFGLIKILYARKKIQRFQLVPSGSKSTLKHCIDKLSSLQALESMFLIYCNSNRINLIPSIAISLTNLKALYITSTENRIEMISNGLTKLEELYIEKDSIDVIIQFATKSPNIKRIVLTNVTGNIEQINVWDLIKKRENLHNAKQLKIFINEQHFLALPGALSIDYKGIINFKRIESLHIDHPFYNYNLF